MFKYADYIYEIYQQKSFTKAAKNLFISQPALSATVKKLEEELQVQLFDRTTTPLSLTLEGEAYIKAVEEIFSIKKDYQNYVIDASNLNVGNISISGANFISSYVIPKIIVPFSKKHPSINIELVESNSNTLVQELINDHIDLLIDYDLNEELLSAYPLFEETILLCVPKHLSINQKIAAAAWSSDEIRRGLHRTEEKDQVSLKLFAQETFLMMKSGNSMNQHGFRLCREAGFAPNVSIYFDQLMTSYNMAAAGLGIAFVTDTLVQEVAPNQNLLFYQPKNLNTHRTVYLLHKKRRYLNRVIKEFIHIAKEVYP